MKRDELEERLITKYGFVICKKELSTIIGLSLPSIDRLIATSEISYFKVSSKPNSAVRFEISEVVDYIYRQKVISFNRSVA